MKKTFTILVLLAVVIACSRKTITTTTATQTKTLSPSADKADGAIEAPLVEEKSIATETVKRDPSNNDALVAGQRVYTVNCGRCHELHSVDKFNTQRWEGILKSMIPKAKLNAQQGEQVKAYVMANAKK